MNTNNTQGVKPMGAPIMPKSKIVGASSQSSLSAYMGILLLVLILGGYIFLVLEQKNLRTQKCELNGCAYENEEIAKKDIHYSKISEDSNVNRIKKDGDFIKISGNIELNQLEYKKEREEVLAFKTKLDPFIIITNNRKEFSRIFSFLERSVLPEVAMTGFTVRSDKDEIILNGSVNSDNFYMLAMQYYLLQKDQDIKSVELDKLSLSTERKVDFTFNVLLKPNVYKYITN